MKCVNCLCNVSLNLGLGCPYFWWTFFGVLTNYLCDHSLIKSDTNLYTVAKLRMKEMSLEYPSHWCLWILSSAIASSQPYKLVGKCIGAIQSAALPYALNSADPLTNPWWSCKLYYLLQSLYCVILVLKTNDIWYRILFTYFLLQYTILYVRFSRQRRCDATKRNDYWN